MPFLTLKIQQYYPALAFFAGFIWDAVTLGQGVYAIDLWILSAYLLATTPIIWWLARRVALGQEPNVSPAVETQVQQSARKAFLTGFYERLPYLLLQFLYGSILSALFILYFKSASHITAIVWTVALAGLLIANEFLENAYKRFTLTWTLFGFCTILLFNFVIPYVVGSVNPIWFYLSVALAVLLTQFLKVALAERVGKIWPTYLLAGLLVSAYIGDVIPPVPLVKRDIQVGTQLAKTDSAYVLMQDSAPWWMFWRSTSNTVFVQEGDKVYCISAIFAPTGLNTKLYHRWQKYDAKAGWQGVERIGFVLSGGRDQGYRGYTYKSNVTDGEWRVNVETENAHTITSYRFEIKRTQNSVDKVPKAI